MSDWVDRLIDAVEKEDAAKSLLMESRGLGGGTREIRATDYAIHRARVNALIDEDGDASTA